MLTQAEHRLVAARLASVDHDYFSMAGVAGEPFLRHGLICYFDGHSVEISGVPVDGTDASLACRVQHVIDEWANDPDVRNINYVGPAPVEMPRCRRFACHYREGPLPWNLDVFVDLTAPLMTGRKLRANVRRAARRGISVDIGRREYLRAEHLRLLSRLSVRADMSLDDMCTISSAVTILRHPATFAVEARRDGRLVGFAVCHGYFETTAVLACSAFEPGATGASDAVYAAMLTHCRERGATRMALGYATDAGLYHYKTKWGRALVGQPFHQRIWGVGPEEDCLYWPWRLMRNSWEVNNP